MNTVNWLAIAKAIDLIRSGTCKKVEVSDGVKVYEVKNIIRIDIKVS